MGNFQRFLEKYHMDKWFCKENLVVMILAGILLVVIALPTKEEEEDVQEQIGSTQTDTLAGAKAPISGTEDYAALLEEKLAGILSQIEGAGEVCVMITLQESEELIVEKDIASEDEQTVYESDGNTSAPYVVKTIYPKVEGVVVIEEL